MRIVREAVSGVVVPLVVVSILVGAVILGTSEANAAPAPQLPVGATVPTEPGPRQFGRSEATRYDRDRPGAAPAGTNDFGCVPSAAHPRPVILVHGTDASAYSDWAMIAPILVDDGRCVFALDYGRVPDRDGNALGDMRTSAHQLAAFVDVVRERTGAESVDLVGYSQGANVARWYVNLLGGAAVVERWVGLASPSRGSIAYGLAPLLAAIPGGPDLVEALTSLAVRQQMAGSPELAELNAGGDTVPGVTYTTIGSRVDEMIQPASSMALDGPDTHAVFVQDGCPQDLSGHFLAPYDPYVADLVRLALDPSAEPRAACVPVRLGTGIAQVVLDSHS
ncbi:alpha/beta fold hydrolase [Rhodococcus rhodnii]|nr:alpha/beta fold hydrolase [Rhodococcus rhodnii]TXG92689.1 alpha/beta fold hydrolase [Rhodococcus rhodnii]